jgi:glutaminyl-peptide cyclotransferase
MFSGCTSQESQADPKKDDASGFASDREVAVTKPVAFDGKRAMGYLEEICDIGPRISGSDGMAKQRELLVKHFEKLGAKVRNQTFKFRQLTQRNAVEMTNLIVSWHTERKRRVLICSHYDTRPIADQEPDPRKWRQPLISANDGGSGVAFLMELAHHINNVKTDAGVDFVLFDGEEYIFKDRFDKYFLGSEHFAREYRKTRDQQVYMAAILLDMIGGKDARFPAERYSWIKAGALVSQIWRIATELKCAAFVNKVGSSVQDDHLALIQAGIPAIDITSQLEGDFKYRHWHRLTDLPENCSSDGLVQVAKVLSVWLQRL